MMVREHSNTGHLELMKAWRNIAKENPLFWWWAGYSWPASHQLCYTDEPVDIYQDIDTIHLDNQRCELLRKEKLCFYELINRVEDKLKVISQRFFEINNVKLTMTDQKITDENNYRYNLFNT